MIPASWAIRTVLEINWSALIGPNETMRVVDGGIARAIAGAFDIWSFDAWPESGLQSG